MSERKRRAIIHGDGCGEGSAAAVVGVGDGSDWDLNVIAGKTALAGRGVVDAVRPGLDEQVVGRVGDIVCACAAAGVVDIAIEGDGQTGELGCVGAIIRNADISGLSVNAAADNGQRRFDGGYVVGCVVGCVRLASTGNGYGIRQGRCRVAGNIYGESNIWIAGSYCQHVRARAGQRAERTCPTRAAHGSGGQTGGQCVGNGDH